MVCNKPLKRSFPLQIGLVLAGFLLNGSACRDAPDLSAPQSAVARTSQTGGSGSAVLPPGDLVDRLREYHRLRQYQRIEDHIAPDRRGDLIKLLAAVDRILVANEEVMRAIRRTCSPETSQKWDLSPIADNIGIFSEKTKTVDTIYEKDRALVHYQVGGTIPLRKAVFIRRNGRWLYQPDSVPGLPELLDELAVALNILLPTLGGNAISLQEIDSEYRHRILPIIRRIEMLPAAGEDSAPQQAAP